MASKILLEIVTPDKLLFSENVDVVVATGVDGEFGVLYGHVPFLSSLAIGELRYRDSNRVGYIAVSGGFAEISGAKVTVLAETAELAQDIDLVRAKEAKKRAEKHISKVSDGNSEIDYARASAALKRSILRIRVVERDGSGQ